MQLLILALLTAPSLCISYEKLLHGPQGYRSIVKQQLQSGSSFTAPTQHENISQNKAASWGKTASRDKAAAHVEASAANKESSHETKAASSNKADSHDKDISYYKA